MKSFFSFKAAGFLLLTCLLFAGCGSGLTNFSTDRSVQDMETEKFMHDLNWDIYANAARGVTFRFPKVVIDPINPLCPTPKIVVQEQEEWIYVAPERVTSEGGKCENATTVTAGNIREFSMLSIAAGMAEDQAGVETFLRKVFTDEDCFVNSMTVFRDGPQQLVIRGNKCDRIPDDVTILFHPDLKKVMVYPSKPKLQVFRTIDPQKKGFVRKDPDQEVWSSIGFAK